MKKVLVKVLTIMMAAMIMFGMSSMETNASTSRCLHSGCNNKTVSGSNYCSTHKCKKSGCTSCGLKKYGGYCSSSHQSKSKSSSGTTTKKKSSSTTPKKRYSMPDCDDYEDYDDFMDDWDGCMPDGLDAEDYWENW